MVWTKFVFFFFFFFFLFCFVFFIHSCSHTIGSCYTHLLPYFYIIEILYFYLNVYIVKCNCIYVIHGFENNAFFFFFFFYLGDGLQKSF